MSNVSRYEYKERSIEIPVRSCTPDELTVLMRWFVAIIEACQATNYYSDNPNERDTVVDLEIEGVRYRLIRSTPQTSDLGPSPDLLSPREATIGALIARGHSNKSIATALSISPWTVSTHLRRIFRKLNVHSRAEMVAHLSDVRSLEEAGDQVRPKVDH